MTSKAKKYKKMRELENSHISKGTKVKIAAKKGRITSRNGQCGTIVDFKCMYNPIPIVKLESGILLPVELKNLIIHKQTNLF